MAATIGRVSVTFCLVDTSVYNALEMPIWGADLFTPTVIPHTATSVVPAPLPLINTYK